MKFPPIQVAVFELLSRRVPLLDTTGRFCRSDTEFAAYVHVMAERRTISYV